MLLVACCVMFVCCVACCLLFVVCCPLFNDRGALFVVRRLLCVVC